MKQAVLAALLVTTGALMARAGSFEMTREEVRQMYAEQAEFNLALMWLACRSQCPNGVSHASKGYVCTEDIRCGCRKEKP